MWPFYYSRGENRVYRGYCGDLYSNNRYQFNSYKGEDDKVFDYDPVDQNTELAYTLTDAVPVDIAHTPRGWRVCQHQAVILPAPLPEPITDFIQFAQPQPEYIS